LATLGLSETFEHRSAMFIRHIEHVAAGRCNLLEHLGHVYLPIFWQFF